MPRAPMFTREVILSNSDKVALVDVEDYEAVLAVGPWKLGSWRCYDGRACNKSILMHRLIAKRMGIEGMVDHKNRQPLDNRRCNLRPATHSQNMANREKSKPNKSGHKGVYLEIDNGYGSRSWTAQVTYQRKKYRKRFPYTDVGLSLAIAWHEQKSLELFGEFACV